LKNKSAVFQKQFIEDLGYWIKTDRKTALRVIKIMEDVLMHHNEGIGKPEHLKYLKTNVWSRRLTQEHRVVYLVEKDIIHFLQCRYHY